MVAFWHYVINYQELNEHNYYSVREFSKRGACYLKKIRRDLGVQEFYIKEILEIC